MVFNCCDHYKNIPDPWTGHKNNANDCIKKNKPKFDFFDIESYLNKIGCQFNILNCQEKNMQFFIKKKRFFIILIVLMIIIFIWIVSGLYTIREAERGVVLRFGKYHHLVYPGLNWKPTFIDIVIPVNVESVRELAASGTMLTADENVVRVEMNVQYKVTDPKSYLFNVIDADDSLRQATDSALRGVIGKYNMDRILTEGRTVVRSDTRKVLEKTIYPYNTGITLLDVNFQTARPPEEVKAAFDDAIAARENEQQYIREAEAYANEVQPRANGQAQRILEEGRAYKARTVLEAQGEVQRFSKILPEYKAAPEITRERLYINSMERVLSNTQKIFLNSKDIQNMLLLSTDQIFKDKSGKKRIDYNSVNNDSNLKKMGCNNNVDNNLKLASNTNLKSNYKNSVLSEEKILSQQRNSVNSNRVDVTCKGRG